MPVDPSDSAALQALPPGAPPETSRAVSLAQRVGALGLAAVSLLGALAAGSVNVEAAGAPVAAKSAENLDTWLLSGGSTASRWPGAPPAAPNLFRSPAVPEVLTMAELPAPEPERPAPTVSRQEKARPGDYVKHGVNFSHLLRDAEFQDWRALETREIQDLLESMDSFLADYTVGGETAAAMIGRIAREHEVNPWLLLATLEKESSMVSREKAPPARRLQAAMGYGYDDGGSRAGKGSNLGWQLEKGAKLLRELFDEGRALSYPQKMRVDYGKRRIQVRNAATRALMMYTPHTVDTHLSKVGGGNYLFRRHYERFQRRHVQLFAARQVERGPAGD